MNFIDALSTIAEYSIGIAGFTGIVTALAKFQNANASLLSYRLSNLLTTAFVPGFSSLIALALTTTELDEVLVVRASSILLTLYMCGWSYRVIRRKQPNTNKVMTVFMWSFSIINLFAQAFNAVSVEPLTIVYLGGLIALLVQAAVVFSVVALSVLHRESFADDSQAIGDDTEAARK
ncbi:MAG: hypothetical protein GKR90_11090 [Pseudomonadales bacterium]|nr:hypothetical protein [Pseudomonadales bacterium]